MDIPLQSNERIDYLFHPELKIIQSSDVFNFSLDAVLLARFVYVPIQQGKLIDLCSGTGSIPIILAQRSKGEITAVEIQPKLHQMARRSMKINEIHDRVKTLCMDVKELPEKIGSDQFDILTCNPPYFPADKGMDKNINAHMAIARHEIHLTLHEMIATAGRLVKQGGKAAFVHRPERLMAILTKMREHRLEPKRILFVHPKQGKEANIVLIEGTKNGKEGLKVLPPLTVYQENGRYTKELEDFCYEKQ